MKIKNTIKKLSSLFIPFFGGIFGALGGADNSSKKFRRILIPLALFGYAFIQLENIYTITILSLIGVLSMGYGIPDNTDEGSFLGRLWYKLFKQNHFLSDIFTRGTIGLLESLCLISIPIIKHNWIIYLFCSLGIILVNSLISWRNWGQYELFNKKLNWSETITYFGLTLFAMLMIIL